MLVTLEYDADPENAAAFQDAMRDVRGMRKRNGAISWKLVQDSENPRHWLELFVDESWLEHLRHHQRISLGKPEGIRHSILLPRGQAHTSGQRPPLTDDFSKLLDDLVRLA